MDTQPAAMPKNNNPMMMTVIVGIVLALAGFGGGIFFQKSQDSLKGLSGTELQKKMTSLGLGASSTSTNTRLNINGRSFGAGFPGGGNFGGRGGFVSGEIVSADATSITVKDSTGSTKVVYYSGTTTIDKTVTGAAADLTVGLNVTTNGTSNSDGSVAATTIQIRPAGSTTGTPPTDVPFAPVQ